jgi:hypothetical protein
VQPRPTSPLAQASIWRTSASALRHIAIPGIAGVTSGSFAAWAYYDDTFNHFAHTFGLWIYTVVIVAARRTMPQAIVSAIATLAPATTAFYVGKKIAYATKYPGMPYDLNIGQMVQWIILTVVAGVILGPLASQVGRTDRRGTAATAAAAGLLIADTYRRVGQYTPPHLAIPVLFTVLAAGTVLALGARTHRQLLTALLATPPLAAAGYVLVGAPDALEQFLATGSIAEALTMLILGHT